MIRLYYLLYCLIYYDRNMCKSMNKKLLFILGKLFITNETNKESMFNTLKISKATLFSISL